MPAFTQTEYDLVSKAYAVAQDRVERLGACNDARRSDIRTVAIETLTAHQEQISNLGFFRERDYSLEEIAATIEAANAILATEEQLEHAHELTLIELQTDLAQLLQNLATDDYLGFLKNCWRSARRRNAFLTQVIPDEVCDEFHVALFNKCQGRLNLTAYHLRDVSRLGCLNSDDYTPMIFPAHVWNPASLSAQEAVDNYITLQKLKQAEQAEREASEIGTGGQIWSLIGWDSPTDFLLDLGLFVITGGASRVYRWTRRLQKARQDARRISRTLELALKIKERAQKLERRVDEIRKAAEKLKKAKGLIDFPKKLAALLAKLEDAAEQVKLVKEVGKVATADYIRSVVPSVVAKSTGVAGSMVVANEASKELVLTSLRALLDGTVLGTQLKNRRSTVNFTVLIAGRSERKWKSVGAYFALLVTRDFVARSAYTLAHKRSWRTDDLVKDTIDSFAAAVDTLVVDITGSRNDQFVRAVITINRKWLAEVGKRLATELRAE